MKQSPLCAKCPSPVRLCPAIRSSQLDRSLSQSRQNVAHNFACHIGQPEIAAGVAVGELGVVEAQEMEDRGVEVVDVNRVLDHAGAELVGGTRVM